MKSTPLTSNKRHRRVRPCRFPRYQRGPASRSKPLRLPMPAAPVDKLSLTPLAKIDIFMSEDLLALFRKTGALLDGHFVLRSGLHSRQYFQCAILLQHTEIAEKVCKQLAEKLRTFDCDSVVSP